MKQKVLAAKCNISESTLCNIEKGNSNPSYKTLETIADALEVSQGYLIFMSCEDKDIQPDKKVLYNLMKVVLEQGEPDDPALIRMMRAVLGRKLKPEDRPLLQMMKAVLA